MSYSKRYLEYSHIEDHERHYYCMRNYYHAKNRKLDKLFLQVENWLNSKYLDSTLQYRYSTQSLEYHIVYKNENGLETFIWLEPFSTKRGVGDSYSHNAYKVHSGCIMCLAVDGICPENRDSIHREIRIPAVDSIVKWIDQTYNDFMELQRNYFKNLEVKIVKNN